MPKRMKKLARMFYGRAASYDGPIGAADAPALAEALMRNVFPESKEWPEGIDYARHALTVAKTLDEQPDAAILAGEIVFPRPSGAPS